MPIMTLSGTEIVTNITPISNYKGNTVNIITIKKSPTKIDMLTRIFLSLPIELRAHTSRVAFFADLMAKKVDILPNDININVYVYSVWLGCLYHHIGESLLNENIWDFSSNSNVEKEIVLDIVRNCCERYDASGCLDKLHDENISLAARLAGLADTLDELYFNVYVNEVDIQSKIAQFFESKGESLFGTDAMKFFNASREEIFYYYAILQQKHKQGA